MTTPTASHAETRAGRIRNLEIFLLGLRYKEGRLIELEGNKPIVLNDPNRVWIVYSGSVNAFAVPIEAGDPVGARTHLFSGSTGQSLFGVLPSADGAHGGAALSIIASGIPGTRLLEMSFSKFEAYARELEYSDLVTAMLEDWVTGLSTGMASAVLPKDYALTAPNQTATLADGQVLAPKRDIVWAACETGGFYHSGAPDTLIERGMPAVPLANNAWITSSGDTRIRTFATADMLQDGATLKASLSSFHALTLHAVQMRRDAVADAEAERLVEKQHIEQQAMQNALRELALPLQHAGSAALTTKPVLSDADALFEACRAIGQRLGISMTSNKRVPPNAPMGYLLRTIAQASHVQLREVALRGNWWQRDNGPILAFLLEEAQHPVALLPRTSTQYEMLDPRTGVPVLINKDVAARLSPIAYSFYKPFPLKPLKPLDLLRFGFHGNVRDVRAILGIGLLISLLGLLPPIVTGWAFNQLIPAGDTQSLVLIGVMLVAMAVVAAAMQIARGIATLRVQAKFDATVQAALWDRLLALPADFFRRYSAGDLGTRAMGISELRRTLSGYVISTLVNGLFSVVNLVLLFFYAPPLALVAIGLAAVAFGVTSISSLLLVRSQRSLQDVSGRLSGTILQILTGVSKFRVAGAEHFAFALWAKDFSDLKQRYYRSRLINNAMTVFNGVFPLISTLCVFGMLILSKQAGLSTGDFLAFNLAFTQFMNAWMSVGTVLATVLKIIPTFEQIEPVLATRPEVDDSKADPGELSGGIEVSHVFFRYSDKTPPTLRDVSLNIQPGEFVALVGASGSGKSTLFRMLLGLASPESGGVYFDNQDLKEVNAQEVRRQVGIVLQNAAVMPGDIYTNIVGSWPNLSVEDAWEAARMAGLADDIEKMPMGMNTVVSERGGNLSGGQRQRLLIARALVNRPRIILFDEATSALDNQTQDIVSRSLENMKATRVVIAHRLSTIINADRIFVFDAGQIVQTGTYKELANQPGLFSELARRQVV